MFLENKYTRWYQTIIKKAKSQNRVKKKKIHPDYVYYESHHIIPKSMGGIEQVLLTAKEHYLCHLLLCKMTVGKEKHKMINALIKMSYAKSKGQERHVSRSFAVVKALIAEKNSEMFKGVPKSEQTKQNMKGRTGTWVRTAKHKEAFKLRLPNMSGANNPFYGKTHSIETIELLKNNLNRKHFGNNIAKGRIWVTNGELDKMVYPDQIPDNFYIGRIKNRKNNYARKKE